MNPAKSVGIWIRVSTEDQARGESPEHHERRARAYAESKGWDVTEVYHLEAVSGKSVMDHEETKRMLADIRYNRITGLIFSKLARLARNTKELLEFSEIFHSCNSDLISLQEAIDTSSPAGRFFYTVIAAMAQWEREEIADRVAASVPIRAKLGKTLGGAAPFGYQYVEKKLVPHPDEAPIRKRIYELFLEHRRKKTVARILNESGLRTRKGAKWDLKTIARLLRDPVAKGIRRTNYSRKQGKNHVMMKPQTDWVFQEVEPIISEDLWNRCNSILDEQERRTHRPARQAVHLFTGYVFCEKCNTRMYVPSNSPKYTCYKCRRKMGVEELETIFHEQLKTFVFSEEEINDYLDSADQVMKEKEELVASLTNEAERLKAEMERIYRLYVDGEIPSKGFGDKYKPLFERVEQIEKEIPTMQGEIDFLKIQYLSGNEIIIEARDIYSRWTKLETAEKRRIVETITEAIQVGHGEIAINLSYLPGNTEMAARKVQTPAGLMTRNERTSKDINAPRKTHV